jgi:hypothetical protein
MTTAYLMLAAHLRQSTVFAIVLGLLTLLLRKNPARTRSWVWFAALTKSLVPFGVLSLGGQNPGDTEAEAGPLLFTALKEQLGLKLESAREVVGFFIIDQAERPSED